MDVDGPAVVIALGQQLNEAAEDGAIERVVALLDQGVAIDSRDDVSQCTPLMWASDGGHGAIAALLCDRGANVNARINGGAPQ